MKIIDEKGKLFGLINLIDLFVAIMILALVGFGGYKMIDKNPKVQAVTQKATMKFFISEVKDVTVNAIADGEVVKDYDKNIAYGKVVKKEVKPAKRLVPTAEGKITEAEVPGKYDVLVYIEGDATFSNTAIIMANQEMRVGATIGLKGQKFAVRGTVMDVIKK